MFMQNEKNPNIRVAFSPSLKELASNPYWEILASALQLEGFSFCFDSPTIFSFKWLLKNHSRVNILHIHFVQPFYMSGKPGKIRIIYVISLGLKLLLARLLGFRLIYTYHDSDPPLIIRPVWADKLGHLMVVRLSHRVIVHCEAAKSLIIQKYGRQNQINVIDHPNYIGWYPNTIGRNEARKKLGISDTKKIFTFLGSIRPNKGVELLISAFRKTISEDYVLIIAGKVSNSSQSYFQDLLNLSKGDNRIIFHPTFVPDNEIQIFLNATDIVVLPFSKILTSGSTILAMSFGRPVISPRIGCLPELIDSKNGWLFEPENSDSLAEILEFAINCDIEQYGQNAFNKIIQYSSEHFSRQTIKAYVDSFGEMDQLGKLV
jgi:beta-1,4-mannosyltransferase